MKLRWTKYQTGEAIYQDRPVQLGAQPAVTSVIEQATSKRQMRYKLMVASCPTCPAVGRLTGRSHPVVAVAVLGFALASCSGTVQAGQARAAKTAVSPSTGTVSRTSPVTVTSSTQTLAAVFGTSTEPTHTSIGGLAAAGARYARTKSTTRVRSTTSTVMGGGNPATWPAAKPYPPSLAGAYSTNLKRAFITLMAYTDWLSCHPNPKLVRNAVVPGANIYGYWVTVMAVLAKKRWHEPPNPTDIEFMKVVNPVTAGSGFLVGTVDVVINFKTYPYLGEKGQVVGYGNGGGSAALSVILGRANVDQHFRIARWYVCHPKGGIMTWERQLEGGS